MSMDPVDILSFSLTPLSLVLMVTSYGDWDGEKERERGRDRERHRERERERERVDDSERNI